MESHTQFYCEYHSDVLSDLLIIASTFHAVIALIIAWSAHSKGLNRSHQTLKRIFDCTLILCLLYFVLSILVAILCFNSRPNLALIMQILSYAIYLMVNICCLYTVFIHLKFEFNGTIYQISDTKTTIFNVLLILLSILCSITIIVYGVAMSSSFSDERNVENMAISLIVFICIDAILYWLGSVWVIINFRGRLYHLTELQSNTMVELIDGHWFDDVDLKSVKS
eukprot:323957_1